MARKKNILVVGGAGFIGTQICRSLLEMGNKVILVDHRRDFRHIEHGPADAREAFWKEKSAGSLKTVFCSIQHYWANIKHAETGKAIDAIVVAAADPIDIKSCEKQLGRAMKGHLEPLLASLQLARYVNAGIVFLSSAAIYGEGAGKGALVESNALFEPPSFYGVLKKMAEQLLDHLAPEGKAALAARVFNVLPAGAGGAGGAGVGASFERALLAGEKAVIHGDGEQIRDFLPVEEVGKKIALLASAIAEGRVDDRTAVNICSGEGKSMIDLAEDMGVEYELDASSEARVGMQEVVGDPSRFDEWAAELSS